MTPASSSRPDRVARYLDLTAAPPGTRTEELPGDASTRRYVRVREPGGRSRMLLVHPDPIDPDTLPFLNVATLLRRMEIRVPAVMGAYPDLGIVELQDLGDVTLQDFLSHATHDQRVACYRDAIAMIDRLQRRGRDMTSTTFLPFGLAFDADKLMWELDFFVEHFVIGARGASLPPEEHQALRAEFQPIVSELAAEPRVLCHRDFHSRNLMHHEQQLYVIDFQDARMGPDTYDLVSLLRDCYVDQEPDFVEQMIDQYLSVAPPTDPTTFRRRFDVMSVQRHLKALGTFGYQTRVAGNRRYQQDVPRTLAYLVGVFDTHRRFDRLRVRLARHVPELG